MKMRSILFLSSLCLVVADAATAMPSTASPNAPTAPTARWMPYQADIQLAAVVQRKRSVTTRRTVRRPTGQERWLNPQPEPPIYQGRTWLNPQPEPPMVRMRGKQAPSRPLY